MKYGFIGLGNMAGAIISGMAASGKYKNDNIYGYNRTEAKTNALHDRHGLIPVKGASELVSKSEVIVLAVKPQVMPTVVDEIAELLCLDILKLVGIFLHVRLGIIHLGQLIGYTAAIDNNIRPENIKRDIEILGVIGTYRIENLQDKTVDPQQYIQTITFDSALGYEGLNSVTVNPVTSSVDSNIRASNIKKDVTILGVTGEYDPQPTLQSKSVDPTTLQQTVILLTCSNQMPINSN